MKSVKSLIKWILFVPVCAMSVALAIISGANAELAQSYFATDTNGIAEIIAFSILGLFLACFVLSLFDKTTSPVHLLRKNYFCGICAFIGAFAFAATAALDITTMIQINIIDVMSMITAVFTALAGIALLFVGLSHFSGTNTTKGTSIFYLLLPLWCGVHLIDRFLKHTATPVDAADTMDLIMFVALAMFFINATMVHVLIPGKNAVKSAVTFGFPAVVSTLVYGISQIFSIISSDSNAMIDFIPAVGYIIIGLYTLGFVTELSFKAKTVEEQMIVEAVKDSVDSADSDDMLEEAVVATVLTDAEVEEYSDDTEVAPVVEADAVEENISDVDDALVFDDAEQESIVESEPEVDAFYEDDEQPDIPVNLPDTDDIASHEDDIAEQLYRDAQQMDTIRETEDNVQNTAGSEGDMIFDGQDKVSTPVNMKQSASESRPKGPTIREAVMYDDEDFILTVENPEVTDEEASERVEDISSFILEKEEPEASVNVEKTYADRLDEIDQLIISIQGGDSVAGD